jgi:putative hydrolase of the HAD superfamily
VPLNIPDRVVVFDFGEVISRSPTSAERAALLAVTGIAAGSDDARVFREAYESGRDELDRGTLSVPEYWAAIARRLGLTWPLSVVQQLWAHDFRSWISVEPATIDLIESLHAGGTRLALLSNAGFDFGGPLRTSPMASLFERIFISAEMHQLKPEPAIYLEAARELGVEPRAMVFIDNKQENTDAAAELGMSVHHFTGPDGLRDFLEALAV